MRKILIFVVAGFSTRMGGFPKALAKIGGLPVIVHASNHSKTTTTISSLSVMRKLSRLFTKQLKSIVQMPPSEPS